MKTEPNTSKQPKKTTQPVKRTPPTTEQIKADQQRMAERDRKAMLAKIEPAAIVVPVPDNRTPVQQYLDEISPANIAGRLIKFGKDGNFVTSDDGEPIDDDAEFIVLADETLIGWIKFHPDDTPPDRIMGLLYDGFKMPKRETLADLDQSQWSTGLSGQPEDPWKHQICVVLQQTDTRELFTFATTSQTGRRGVGNLLRHYDRMRRTNPNELPVVRLGPGGYQHRDERIGWVATPAFPVVGRAPRDSAAKPDTSLSGDLQDEIPF
jgi:hypothetical protein